MSRVEKVTAVSDVKRDLPFVALFVASFHEACKEGGQMETVFSLLASKTPLSLNVHFYWIDAETVSDLAEEFDVEVVPTMVFVHNNKVVTKVEGALPSKASDALATFLDLLQSGKDTSASAEKALFARIDSLLATSYVFLFMKGTPTHPKCKFSKRTLELLRDANITHFGSFDVLEDEAIRQGLKTYSNWPTFPQLFVSGKLVGGVDILEELAENQELTKTCTPPVPSSSSPSSSSQETKPNKLHVRLTHLINQSPVMLFMKGNPGNPQCGFSSQICAILKQAQIEFDSFDILSDDEVRQGLKVFSDWPTFPQLYVKGTLIGGLDVVKDLAEEEGGLKVQLLG